MKEKSVLGGANIVAISVQQLPQKDTKSSAHTQEDTRRSTHRVLDDSWVTYDVMVKA